MNTWNKIGIKRIFIKYTVGAKIVFSKAEAIQCTPVFNGLKEELDAFIYHIEHFLASIPGGETHEPLIYVVLLKLKGKAAAAIRRLRADTWPEVKLNLIKEFGDNTPIETLLENIETLRQNSDESFQDYKNRTLHIKSKIDEYNGCESEVLSRHRKLHCIGGLRDSRLIQIA